MSFLRAARLVSSCLPARQPGSPLRHGLRLSVNDGKEETLKLTRTLWATFLAVLPMFGQSVLDAPNEPAPVEREAIPENERNFPIHYLLRTHRYDAVLDLLPLHRMS